MNDYSLASITNARIIFSPSYTYSLYLNTNGRILNLHHIAYSTYVFSLCTEIIEPHSIARCARRQEHRVESMFLSTYSIGIMIAFRRFICCSRNVSWNQMHCYCVCAWVALDVLPALLHQTRNLLLWPNAKWNFSIDAICYRTT